MSLVRSASMKKLEEMRTFDMKKVIAFILKEGWMENEVVAMAAVDALLMWLAGHAVTNHQTPYVMMEGPVDKAFHALILNTRLYYAFCQKHVGFFINHTPLDAQSANEFRILGGISYTTSFLSAEFGPELSSLLKDWEGIQDIAAVSCTGQDWEGITQDRSLPNKERYWDEVDALERLAV